MTGLKVNIVKIINSPLILAQTPEAISIKIIGITTPKKLGSNNSRAKSRISPLR